MKRILSIVSNNIESGGVESYLLNAYKSIDMGGISIDILVPGKIIYEKYAEEFRKLGCNIIELNIICGGAKRLSKLTLSFSGVMRKNHYDLVHINTGNLTIEAIALQCAVMEKIPFRLAHSHGTVYRTGKLQEMVRSFLRSRINSCATHKLACSTTAAEALFGKGNTAQVIIAKNGIDANKYFYDSKVRDEVRNENGWGDSYVIGSVGRLAPEKNYRFVIHIFAKLHRKVPNSKLVLIGDGEKRAELEKEAKRHQLQSAIDFLGIRKDVPRLLQGLDVFILASKREALGIVNIEAQATGLPCVVSDVVSKEVDLTGNVLFVDLEAGDDAWTNALLSFKDAMGRKSMVDKVKDSGYDFSTSYTVINDLYHMNIDGRHRA